MRNDRLLIHAHCFYPALWPEIVSCIRNLCQAVSGRADVFITYPEGNAAWAERVRADEPRFTWMPVENRGYDVAPFFKVINAVNLRAYDLVVKLHTKRDLDCWLNFRHLKGGAWREALLSFCSTPRAARRSLEAFRRNPRLGLVGAQKLIDPSGCGTGYDLRASRQLVRQLGFETKGSTVLYGTMFMMRADLLLPAWRKVRYEDFSLIESGREHRDLGLAGVWEGAFCLLAEAQGYYASDGRLPQGLDRLRMKLKGCLFRLLRAAHVLWQGRLDYRPDAFSFQDTI